MGPQQQQFVPWYWGNMNNPMMPTIPPVGQVQMPAMPQQQTPMQPQQQVQPRQSYLQGRMVESENDIKPNEIPMDGTVTFFPKSDLSCVYGKTWTQDGVLKPLKFVREEDIPQPKEEAPSQSFDPAILSDLVEQVVNDKLQSIVQDYLTPISENQKEILSGLKKGKSNLIVPEEG